MEGVLDIRRDHPGLIDACMRVLAPGGLLVFSTNAQKFKLDEALSQRYALRDISAETIPRGFRAQPRIHRCYEIRIRGRLIRCPKMARRTRSPPYSRLMTQDGKRSTRL